MSPRGRGGAPTVTRHVTGAAARAGGEERENARPGSRCARVSQKESICQGKTEREHQRPDARRQQNDMGVARGQGS